MDQLSDKKLRQKLEEHGFDPGPFSEATRSYWHRKLAESECKESPSRRVQPQTKLFNFSSDEELCGVNKFRQRKKGRRKGTIKKERSQSTDEPDHATLDVNSRRHDAVLRVKAAGSRLLTDLKKAHLRDRRTPWYFRFSLHILAGTVVLLAVLLMIRAVESPVGRAAICMKDDLLWCNVSSVYGGECQELRRIERGINLSYAIAAAADELAGQDACYNVHPPGEQVSITLSSAQLHQFARAWREREPYSNDVLVDALRLIAANSHWQLVVVMPSSQVVLTGNASADQLRKAGVVSTNPSKPFSCRFGAALSSAVSHFLVISAGISCLLLVFVGIRKYVGKQEKDRQETFILIDQILTLLIKHYRAYQRGEEAVPFLAIAHVQDTLLPPAKRQMLSALWERAADWIKMRESRVRTETRRISGEDYLVWRWIDIESDNGTQKTKASLKQLDGNLATTEKMRRREEMWGDHVLDHYSSEAWRKQLAPLRETSSSCVKLRNLFVGDVCRRGDEFEEMEACILHKLTQHGGVLHCFLNRWSGEGAFYAKLDSAASATSVIEALHGTWFGGLLVKAEYVSEREYHRLFPSAKTASKVLFPA